MPLSFTPTYFNGLLLLLSPIYDVPYSPLLFCQHKRKCFFRPSRVFNTPRNKDIKFDEFLAKAKQKSVQFFFVASRL